MVFYKSSSFTLKVFTAMTLNFVWSAKSRLNRRLIRIYIIFSFCWYLSKSSSQEKGGWGLIKSLNVTLFYSVNNSIKLRGIFPLQGPLCSCSYFVPAVLKNSGYYIYFYYRKVKLNNSIGSRTKGRMIWLPKLCPGLHFVILDQVINYTQEILNEQTALFLQVDCSDKYIRIEPFDRNELIISLHFLLRVN